ncbi:autotransporter outer membrane beta-barrel domain-containing protein [Pandoraea sp. NPDC090278]|uniref:autotransporter family protein n=1 Tax=Pandoraea sp. NPDC090278 TaxID=3364391 RepID=UPI00383A96A6
MLSWTRPPEHRHARAPLRDKRKPLRLTSIVLACLCCAGLTERHAMAQTLPTTPISIGNGANVTYTNGAMNTSTAIRISASNGGSSSMTFAPTSAMSVSSPTNAAIQVSASGNGSVARFTINSASGYGVSISAFGNFSFAVVASGTTNGQAFIDLGSGTSIVTGGGSSGAGLWATSGGTITGDALTINTSGYSAQGAGAVGGGAISLTNSRIFTTGDYAYGLLNRASHGTYEGTAALVYRNGTISTSGTEAHGIESEGNGATAIHNTQVQTTGASAYGIRLVDSANGTTSTGSPELTIASDSTGTRSSVSTTGAQAHAASLTNLFAGDSATFTASGTTLHAQGTGAYGLFMTGVTGSNEIASLSNSVVQSNQSDAIHVTGPNATITLTNGTSVLASPGYAALNVSADGTSPGNVTLTSDASTLTGTILTDATSTSGVVLRNGSTWNVTGNSNMTTLANDNSTINVQATAAQTTAPTMRSSYTTVNVAGNYTGTNGTLVLNTFLNLGGTLSNQYTDRLLIGGNASGTTLVDVKAVEGSTGPTKAFQAHLQRGLLGAPSHELFSSSDGISIVQVAGASTQGAFVLKNGYATADNLPFQYHLYAYGPGSEYGVADPTQTLVGSGGTYWDYRLQTAFVDPGGQVDPEAPGQPEPIPTDARPEVVPQVAAYLSSPAALLYAGLIDIDTLHRRLGEIRDDRDLGRDHGDSEAFVRVYGGNFNYRSNRSFQQYGYNASMDYSAIQFGGNLFKRRDDNGLWRFGLAGTIGTLHFEPQAVDGYSSARTSTSRVSGYATYQSTQGWYVDNVLSFGWFDGNVSTNAYANASALKGHDIAASIEAGYPLGIGAGLQLEPQAQLVAQHVSFNNQVDADGLNVNIGGQNQWLGRLGMRLTRAFEVGKGRVTPYAAIDYLHAFTGGTQVTVGGVGFTSGKLGDALRLSLGANATMSERMSAYARVSWSKDVGNAGMRGWLFNVGGRYLF